MTRYALQDVPITAKGAVLTERQTITDDTSRGDGAWVSLASFEAGSRATCSAYSAEAISDPATSFLQNPASANSVLRLRSSQPDADSRGTIIDTDQYKPDPNHPDSATRAAF